MPYTEAARMLPKGYVLTRFFPVLLVLHLIVPLDPSERRRLVHHITLIISTVPMRCPRRTPNDVSDADLGRFGSLITYPPGPGENAKDLPLFVRMPVSSRAWHEIHVSDGYALGRENGIKPDGAGEGIGDGGGSVDGGFAAARVAGDDHRHVGGVGDNTGDWTGGL